MIKKVIVILMFILSLSAVYAASPISVNYDDGIYHIVLSGDKIKKKIQFVSTSGLITNKEAHNNGRSQLTINTGFFDPKTQKSVSYIVNDYQTVEDPLFNKELMSNPVIRRNLKKILNRTELRILECDGKLKYEIAPHNAPVDFMCSIKTSAQAGPQLLPEMRLEEEFFIVKDENGNVIRESAGVLHKVPRTIAGIKSKPNGEQELHLFIVTNAHPMTIEEARQLCLSNNLDSAMAFDGGSSTSLDYKNIHVTSTQDSGDTGRALKSFMIIQN